ncbi:MAG: thioesterase [Clostridia bacterium]|nr:thioesterase [Clostridia bacterium]
MIYRQSLKLLSSDVDMYRRLRLSRLFTLLQEAAIAHTEALGMGREKTLDKGVLWALTMQRVIVRRLPEYDEAVELTSWPGETMHVLFPRYYRLADSRGESLVESSALWVLMDAETRGRVYPDDYGITIPGVKLGGEPPMPRVLGMPGTGELPFTVPYSYVDLNGHMNNARLLDLAEDLMPEGLRARPVRSIEAEYRAEAKPGETLMLRTREDGALFTLAGDGAGGRSAFHLRLEYAAEP